jgi:hypothetical protein
MHLRCPDAFFLHPLALQGAYDVQKLLFFCQNQG